jgi:tRNA threonylcarbamoyladenosine biosynthesis protein TsaE
VEWGDKFPSVVKRSQGEIVMTSLDGDARRIVLKMKQHPATASSKNP